MCRIANSVAAEKTGAFHRLNSEVEGRFGGIIGKHKLYGSATDHNQHHLNNAVERDNLFKRELEQVLMTKEREELPIIIVYEREVKLFQMARSYYAGTPGSCVVTGNKHSALIRPVYLYEGEQPEEALCLHLYHYKK